MAEFAYRPAACKHTYRMVVVRKLIRTTRGQQWLFDTRVPFFYITNDWEAPPEAIVVGGERSLQSGEPHWATQERSAGVGHAGG